MSASGQRDFTAMFREAVQPALDAAGAARSRCFTLSGIAAGGVFLLLCGLLFLLYGSDMAALRRIGIAGWPLLLLLPAATAVLTFSIVLLLAMRGMAARLQDDLLQGLARCMGSGFVHDPQASAAKAGVPESLLPGPAVPAAGCGVFRGSAAEAEVTAAIVDFPNQPARRGVLCTFRPDVPFAFFGLLAPEEDSVSISGLTASLAAAGTPAPDGLVRLENAVPGWQVLVPAGCESRAAALLPPDMAAAFRQAREKGGIEFSFSVRPERAALRVTWERCSGGGRPQTGFDPADARAVCSGVWMCLDVFSVLARSPDLREENREIPKS